MFGMMLLLLPMSLRAAEKDSLQVLWVGNSYTFFNDLPATVRDIAASQDLKLAVTRVLKGGEKLSGHWQNPVLQKALKRGGWDYVVLQEFSSTPAYSTESVARDIYPYAHQIDSMAKAHSPNVHVIYYMTWGHKYGNVRQTDYPLDDDYELMQERIKTAYIEMAWMNHSWCAPVGMAWQQVRRERPELQLYTADCFHPSPLGSYLAANVIVTTILQRPYQTEVTCDLPAETAEYLQQVGQQTVLNNLRLLNIKQ